MQTTGKHRVVCGEMGEAERHHSVKRNKERQDRISEYILDLKSISLIKVLTLLLIYCVTQNKSVNFFSALDSSSGKYGQQLKKNSISFLDMKAFQKPKSSGQGENVYIWDQLMQTIIYRMYKQLGPTTQHRELYSISLINHN